MKHRLLIYAGDAGVDTYRLEEEQDPGEAYKKLLAKFDQDYFETRAFTIEFDAVVLDLKVIYGNEVFIPEYESTDGHEAPVFENKDKVLTGKRREILRQRGYVTQEEQDSAWQGILDHPTPYNHRGDMEERIAWWEFCRALKERDFSYGDSVVLNNIVFTVGEHDEV